MQEMQCKNFSYLFLICTLTYVIRFAQRNCLDCAYETNCPYSAKKVYIEKHVKKGWKGNENCIFGMKQLTGGSLRLVLSRMVNCCNVIY